MFYVFFSPFEMGGQSHMIEQESDSVNAGCNLSRFLKAMASNWRVVLRPCSILRPSRGRLSTWTLAWLHANVKTLLKLLS
jgi:hypothetical protein